MSILILYLSKYGAVEEIANTMKNISGETVDVRKLDSKVNGAVIDKYDALIVGGSIHMGKAPQKMIRFCKFYSHFFKEKKVVFSYPLSPPPKKRGGTLPFRKIFSRGHRSMPYHRFIRWSCKI